MKITSLFTVVLLMCSIAASSAATNSLTGSWRGTLEVGPIKLRVLFKITESAAGALNATMDSIDQGASDIPVDTVTLKSNVLRVEVNRVKGVYEGTLDAAKAKATGQWTQGPQTLPLTLEKGQGTDSAFDEQKISPADLAANKQAALKVAGTWNGELATGTATLRLRLNIIKSTTGTATGTMDSLDQGANGIPLSAITLKDGKLRFEAQGVAGVYEGTLAVNGSTLSGEWQQGGASMPLEFKKGPTK